MRKGSGLPPVLSGMFCLFLLLSPGPVAAQLGLGGQFSLNQDLAEETTVGVGVRGQLQVPLTGLMVQGTLDFYDPDCGSDDCDVRDVGVNLLWSLPVPVLVKPYFGAGLAIVDLGGEGFGEGDTEYGINGLGGVMLTGGPFQRLRPFAEVKYQMISDFDDQLVFSGGVLLYLF